MSLVSNPEVMEKIVAANDTLHWNGWDVVQSKENPQAFMKRNAIFKNGKWHSTKVFALSEQGWEIPAALIGKANDLQLGKAG